MSQQRFRLKNRDVSQTTFRKSNTGVKESVSNKLFEETFPDESVAVEFSVKVAAMVHIAVVNSLFLVGQYIILFGNVFILFVVYCNSKLGDMRRVCFAYRSSAPFINLCRRLQYFYYRLATVLSAGMPSC